MTSIFDPPAGIRTFNASDWLAALDGALAAPAAPPPAVDDEPEIGLDDLVIDASPAPWAAPRRLRQWHKATAATVLALALPVGLYVAGWASIGLALAVGAVMLLELVIWLGLAWRFGRL